MGSRNMKTCPRRPKATSTSALHSTAWASSPCFAAKMPCSRRRCCLRKNVSSQVMRSSSASTLAGRSGRPRSCASTPSRSRFNTAVGDATNSVSDCEVGTRRKKTQQPWRRRESRTGRRVSKKTCLDTPRDRGAHVCCRVSVSASAPVPASASVSFLLGSSSLKASLPGLPAGIPVFSFHF